MASIILKKSSVTARVPVTGDLEYGELALNYADGALYYKRSDNTIQNLISAGGVSSFNTRTGEITLSSQDVTVALGYTPLSINGGTLTGLVTFSPAQVWPTFNQNTTGTASNVTGTVDIVNGGTGTTTASGARTNLGASTVGSNLFTLTNPGAVTFIRVNADNSISTLDAATFRSAIGAGTSNSVGTVTSIGISVPTGLSVTNTPITASGTIAITLTSGYSIPTTANQTNWSTAYSWGNHASAGYQSALVSGTSIKTINGSSILGSGNISTNAPRVVSIANGTSITLNCDTTDLAKQENTQAAGTLTINAPTGTPVDGQRIMLRLTSTNAQTFSWNAIFGGSTDMALPTASSGGGKEDYLGFIYDSVATKWHLIAKSFGY